MATPVVTPYVLMQELQKARAKGAPTDPYGLAAAIGSIGTGFDAMNKSILGANQVMTDTAQTDARMNQGYYPAQVGAQVAGFEQQTYDTNQYMSMAKAVEEGHRQATAQGIKIGTPQHDLFMRDFLSSNAGYNTARGAVPAADKAMTKIQNDAFAKTMLQQAIEKEGQHQMAVEFFRRNSGRPDMPPAEKEALTKQAWEYAKQHWQENQVNIDFTPEGVVVAKGKDKQPVPVSPQLVAAAYMAQGNKWPAETLNLLSKDYRATIEERMKTALAQKKVDTPAPPPKPTPPIKNPRLEYLERLYWGLASKPDANVAILAPLKKKIEELESGSTAGIMSPYNPQSLISRAAGAGVPPVLPNAGQMDVDLYGDLSEEEPDGPPDYFSGMQAP